METYEVITTRRSIRKYSSKPVSSGVVKELLTAGMSGPSTGKQEPWHFVVLTERSQIDKLASIQPYQAVLSQVPVAIVVCCDMKLLKYHDFWLMDCSIATQNILLTAHSKGLGSVWLGCHFMPDRAKAVREKLSLPENIMPFSVIPIGYPAEQIPKVERFQSGRVHNNTWA